jgi:hypothetical protein
MKEDKPRAKEEIKDEAKERLQTHAAASTGGAAAGATAGALAGVAAGPLGSLVGAAAGAVAGAAAGAATGAGAEVDTSEYEAYWREHYARRPYVRAGARYEDYEPAYLFGIHEYAQTDHPKTWDEVKDKLGVRWEAHCAGTGLSWQEAEPAVRDAWEHMRDPEGFSARSRSS